MSTTGLDYYVYISDAKVDMLLAQIPEKNRRSIAAELKIDLKLLSLTLKDGGEAAPNRISRVKAVAEHLRRNNWVGAVRDRPEYIEGTLEMAYGLIERRDGGETAAAFVGHSDREMLVLVGSVHHMIGSVSPAQGWSASPYSFITELFRAVQAPEGERGVGRTLFSDCRHYASTLFGRFPVQRLEFLAKRYGSGEDVTIASPLYICMAQ